LKLSPDAGALSDSSDVELLIRATLDSVWNKLDGDWDAVLAFLKTELGAQSEEATVWMRAAVAAGNQLTAAR
jgi:hypothetical protein